MLKKISGVILKKIILLSASFFMLCFVVFAWFAFSQQGSVDNVPVSVAGIENVDISLDGVNYDKTHENAALNGKVTCISGDGETFYTYLVSDGAISGYALLDTDTEEKMREVCGDLELWLRSDRELDLYIKRIEAFPKNLDENISPYGSFSKDYIIGAVRVAVMVEENGVWKTKCIAAPNSRIELLKTVGINNKAVMDIDANGAVEENYSYVTGVALSDKVTIPTALKSNGRYELLGGSANGGVDFLWGENTSLISKVTSLIIPEGESESTTHLKLRVWIEGTDREGEIPLRDGMFGLHVEFATVRVGEE